MIGLPPFAARSSSTTAEPLPGVADTAAGASGAVGAVGVTALDGTDDGPVPTALVADTVNVYAVPFTNPDTTAWVTGGAPVTTVGVLATPATYGVTV